MFLKDDVLYNHDGSIVLQVIDSNKGFTEFSILKEGITTARSFSLSNQMLGGFKVSKIVSPVAASL